MSRLGLFALFYLCLCAYHFAWAGTDCYLINECTQYKRDPSSPAPGTQIKINPSAVPTDKGLGLEAIYFDQEADFAIVRGNGRMGAALSPSNSEETFYGAPGFEMYDDLLVRKQEKDKFPNQKFTLATAISLADKKGTGLRRYSLKAGVMGKYNKLSQNATAGGGVNGALGPFSAGYSLYDDETQLEYDSETTTLVKYRVQTYNIGVYLNSLILNYSHLYLKTQEEDYIARVHLYTASLTSGKFLFTAALRREDSPAPSYNYETEQLETQKIKDEYFGGLQYSPTRSLTIGVLYNYYLLREYSVTATVFF